MARRVDSLPKTFIALTVALAAAIGVPLAVLATQSVPPLTVHEWGTFTTIAGPDGQAMQWLPLGGPTDLPCFVQTYQNRRFKVLLGPEAGALLDYQQARAGLKGTVRMETPVLYFYAERAMTASVTVGFPQGLFTEFYPYAEVLQSPSYANILQVQASFPARISWKSVSILPGTTPAFPSDHAQSHYYAARETDAAPVRVDGQDEKFLFYRGVAGFPVSLSAVRQSDGRIHVKNLSSHTLPAAILFERQNGHVRYRVHGQLAGGADAVLDLRSAASGLTMLREELERTLVAQGLYAREAKAMVETWRDDWFNEGTRVFYIAPAAEVNAILPLQVSPAPASTVRAFVGRMEVITPEGEAAVARALAQNDAALLDAYGRWLGPIGDRIVAKTVAPDEKAVLLARLDGIFKAYLTRVTACQ